MLRKIGAAAATFVFYLATFCGYLALGVTFLLIVRL